MAEPQPHDLRTILRHPIGRWLILGACVGIACGLVAAAFLWATEAGMRLTFEHLAGASLAHPAGDGPHPPSAGGPLRWWWLLALVPLGGLLSGLITHHLARDAAGSGTDAVLQAYHEGRGRLGLRAALAKFAASVCVIGSGGSAGREGPIAMLGAGCASLVGGFFDLSTRDRRILLAAGMAGGIAAIFKTPLAGAVFAAEVLYRSADLEAEVIVPASITAIIAFCTALLIQSLGGNADPGSLFAAPAGLAFHAGDSAHLLGYLVLAITLALLGRAFIRLLHATEAFSARLPLPPWLRPACGGLGAALTALAFIAAVAASGLGATVDGLPRHTALGVLGTGYGTVQTALDTVGAASAGPGLALLLGGVALVKILTTCLSVGSGGSGGLFGPSIVIGGCLGAAGGLLLAALAPAIAPPPAACVVIGMAGFLATTYRTPLAAILMVCDLTGSFRLLLPATWVCACAFLLGGRRTLDRHQLASPLDSPAHRGDFFLDILAGIRVRDVLASGQPPVVLPPSATLDDCRQAIARSAQTIYPIVGADGVLVGVVTFDDLRQFLYSEEIDHMVVAQDLADADVHPLRPEDSLAKALRGFTVGETSELPVVDAGHRLLGLLTYQRVISAYNRTVSELQDLRVREQDGSSAS